MLDNTPTPTPVTIIENELDTIKQAILEILVKVGGNQLELSYSIVPDAEDLHMIPSLHISAFEVTSEGCTQTYSERA